MSIGEVLAPVRERYGHWLGLDPQQVQQEQERPEDVRALQLVLRLERDGSPDRATALSLAATGCALLCLDERSAPGGAWHAEVDAYCRGRIRKITRRARGRRWEATADLPGLTLDDHDTQIRVLVPGLVDTLDARVSTLQVGGTDIAPADPEAGADPAALDRDVTAGSAAVSADVAAHPPVTDPHLDCVVPVSLDLTAGKFMAQTGHAGMIAAALAAGSDPDLLHRWFEAGCPARVTTADEQDWADLLASLDDPDDAWRTRRRLGVRDAGFTEVDPGTITVIASLRADRTPESPSGHPSP